MWRRSLSVLNRYSDFGIRNVIRTISSNLPEKMSQYTVNKTTSDYVDLTVHGIPYNFDDRAGTWSIWNISLFLDGWEEVAERRHSFMDVKMLSSECISYVLIKQVIKLNPVIYTLNFLSDARLQIIMQLCEPGRTSNSHITKVTDQKSGHLLAERFVKLTRIDNETRRPVQNPDQFLEKFFHLKEQPVPTELSRTNMPDQPNNCFEYRTTVRFSDMDNNFHANQSLYIKSCFDCASSVGLQGRLLHFTGDTSFYPVLDISIDYLGECFVGDEIVVSMWQAKQDVSEFNFVVYKASDMKKLTFIVCHLGLDKLHRESKL